MNSTQEPVKKRRGRFWIKLAGALLLVLVVAYFVVTSSAFFKGVILPKVGSALNADVSVSDATVSPFSHVVLHDLKVTPKSAAPLFGAASVTVRYDLLAIIHGNIRVSELSVVSPTVTIVENADGTSNLDPLLKTGKTATAPAPQAPAKPAAPPMLDIKSIALKDATFRYVKNLKDGQHQTMELTQLNVAIDDFKNGGTGKMDVSAVMASEQPSNTALEAKINAAFTFHLTADAKPDTVKGGAGIEIDKATGQFAQLAALAAKLDFDVTPTEIRQCALAFSRADAALGEVRVTGPFDPAKLEGKLKVDVVSLDRQVLNLAGAAAGLDFGSTTVNTSNEIELTKGGAVVTAAGTVNVARLQVTRQNETSPTVDVRCEYAVTVNRAEQSVLVKTLNLTGTQGQRPLLQAELTSPMLVAWGDTSNAVGDAALNLTVTGLNLANWRMFAADLAPAGVANATLKLSSQQGGKQLVFDLDSRLDGFSTRVGKEQTSPVDVRLNANGGSADLKQFKLNSCRFELVQQNESLLTISGNATFDKISDDGAAQFTIQAALGRLTKLIAPWIPSAGGYAPGGTANVKLNVEAQGGAKRLVFGVDAQVDQFSARVGGSQFKPVDVQFAAKGDGANLKQFHFTDCRLNVAQQGQAMLALSAVGGFDTAFTSADLQITAQAALDKLTGLYPLPDIACSAGSLAVTSHVAMAAQTLTVTGQVTLADFTGGYGNYQFTNLATAVDLDVALKGKQVEIHKMAGQLRENQVAGGGFDASGSYDLEKKTGMLSAKLVDFTERDLGPILQPSLGDKKLVSVSLHAVASAGFNASGDGTVKADVQVTHLVVRDPMNKIPDAPLEAHLILDAAASNKVATVRQGLLALTPTQRATNELDLTGTVDYSQSNAITGSIKLAADSLDATAYYDLFGGTNKSSSTTSTAKSTPPTAAAPTDSKRTEQPEPAPVTLPVRNFICEIAIQRLYLRQVDIANLQTTVKVDGGHIALKQCQLTLNGALITAAVDLNLGVPGYEYDITFKADKVPLEPLVNSFSPTYSDKAQGDLSASLQFKGAGITGLDLRKDLAGTATLSFTNANIPIVGPKVKAVLTPIALVLGAPQLLQSPLDYIMADVQIGSGRIETRQFVAHSAAFRAVSQGSIPIADVLTDSPLSQPVDVELAQGIATQLKFANLPTDGSYSKLPTFVHLAGTLGDPTAKVDKTVIAGLTAQGVAGAIGGRAGGILGAVGGLLSGQTPSTNAAPQQAPSQQPLPFNPFKLLR